VFIFLPGYCSVLLVDQVNLKFAIYPGERESLIDPKKEEQNLRYEKEVLLMKKIFWLTWICVLILVCPAWGSMMKSIGKDRVNVRSKPSLHAPVEFQAYLGYPIAIKKQKKNWVYFTDWKNNTGWVYKPLVSNIKTAVILGNQVNIRKGPSVRTPVVARASQGEIYKIFAEKGNWVKVGYYLENEEVGWVRDDLVWGE
jgi:SH3-like domain-containing protein